MRTILDEIVSTKLVEISKLKQKMPLSECIATPLFNRSVVSLRNALQNHFGVIAEIKRKSPSAGVIVSGLDPASQVEAYEKKGAAGISVLTDHTYFGGSIEDLKNIRSKTDLPLLRKEFILDEYQLFESKAAGADSILLIASVLEKEQAHHLTIVAKSLELEVLFEIHSFEELHKINDEVDFVHNYYERLVLQEIYQQSPRVQNGDRDFLADAACVALNRLPPRYIRHDVDMTFFMSPQDMMEIERKVTQAVTDALNYVESRERGEDPKLPPLEVALIATRADKPTKSAKSAKEELPAKPGQAKTTDKPKTRKKKDQP